MRPSRRGPAELCSGAERSPRMLQFSRVDRIQWSDISEPLRLSGGMPRRSGRASVSMQRWRWHAICSGSGMAKPRLLLAENQMKTQLSLKSTAALIGYAIKRHIV